MNPEIIVSKIFVKYWPIIELNNYDYDEYISYIIVNK
jgi:hypothetical protein